MQAVRVQQAEQSCHFRDGLGERWLRTAGAGDTAEVLRPLRDLARKQASIRDRFARLSTMRLARFVTVQAVNAIPKEEIGLEIVSDYVPGTRLSAILRAAEARHFEVPTDAAFHVVRQVLGALAAFHLSRSVTHGAIAPERIIVTPRGHVVVTDCVLGLAIERLGWSRMRLWNDLQIPMPLGSDVLHFDQQADVAQVGFTALALLAGRPLGASEYPKGLSSLIEALRLTDGDGKSVEIPKALKTWLTRVLRLEPIAPFATAGDAQKALEDALAKIRWVSSADNPIKSLIESYDGARRAAFGESAAAPVRAESPATARTVAPELPAPEPEKTWEQNPKDVWPDRPAAFTPANESPLTNRADAPASAGESPFQPLGAHVAREAERSVRRIRRAAEPKSIASRRKTDPAAVEPRKKAAPEANFAPQDLAAIEEPEGPVMLGELAISARKPVGVPRETAQTADADCVVHPAEPTLDAIRKAELPADAVAEVDDAVEVTLAALSNILRDTESAPRDISQALDAAAAATPQVPDVLPRTAPVPAQDRTAELDATVEQTLAALSNIGREPVARTESVKTPEPVVPDQRAIETPVVIHDAAPVAEPAGPVMLGGLSIAARRTLELPREVAADLRVPDAITPAAPEPETTRIPHTAGPVILGRLTIAARRTVDLRRDSFADLEAAKARVHQREHVAHETADMSHERAFTTEPPVAATAIVPEPVKRETAVVRRDKVVVEEAATKATVIVPEPVKRETAEVHRDKVVVEEPAAAATAIVPEDETRETSQLARDSARAIGAAGAAFARGFAGVAQAIGRAAGSVAGATLSGLSQVARGAAGIARYIGRSIATAAAAFIHGLAWWPRAGRRVIRAAVSGTTVVLAFVMRGTTIFARGTTHAIGAGGVAMFNGATTAGRGVARFTRGAAHIAGAGSAAAAHGLALALKTVGRSAGVAGATTLNGLAFVARGTGRVARVSANAAGATGVSAGHGLWRVARAAGHSAWTANVRVMKAGSYGLSVARFNMRNDRYPRLALQLLFTTLVLIAAWSWVHVAGAQWRGFFQPLLARVESAAVGTRTPAPAPPQGPADIGALSVQSQPTGAQVWLDGKLQGETPVSIEKVKAGTHTVLLRHASGSFRTTVRVHGRETAELVVPIYSGWLAVFAPVDLDILEAGVPVGSSENGRLLISPGDHALEFVNARLGFKTTRRVEVKPGEIVPLNITLPPAPLEIVAPPGAEIFVEGRLIGTAPLQTQSVAVGTFEVTMRHATLGEQRQTTTVSYNTPNRIVFSPQN